MCGRYAFWQRPAQVRQQLNEANMPSESAPEDDDVRLSYNFAPGYYGLVYRASTGDTGGSAVEDGHDEPSTAKGKTVSNGDGSEADQVGSGQPIIKKDDTTYKLQAMKWGLIPFWTKRNPDYGSMMKTINCRDDSLIEDRGMWTTMKKKKRCIVVCQGFYEWLKKNNGKDRLPHYIKRKDGNLFCFAGLWDCVKYDDSDEKHYTYTIITTDSNKQLKFLHDRMPVIFDAGSENMRLWLDPERVEWSKELQSLLKPFDGELEIYPVNKDVGKVGNNSPTFIIPLDSTDNKNNIANFFATQKHAAKQSQMHKGVNKAETHVKEELGTRGHDNSEPRSTIDKDTTSETHAPMPVPKKGIKREHSDDDTKEDIKAIPPAKEAKLSPQKEASTRASRAVRSATSNGTKSPAQRAGSQKITKFFGK